MIDLRPIEEPAAFLARSARGRIIRATERPFDRLSRGGVERAVRALGFAS